jgi:hypothetical protein
MENHGKINIKESETRGHAHRGKERKITCRVVGYLFII